MSDTNGVPPAHFVVIVPGYMGSRLRSRSTGELIWLDLKNLLTRDPFHLDKTITRLFETLAYPNDDIEPAGIMDKVVFAPPLFKQEHYNRLVNALVGRGYVLDPTNPAPDTPALYTFSYDWRQDNRISARQLGRAIEAWSARHPGAKAWIIAHSNGGLVSRWYIEKEGGAAKVGRLFLMGSPWDGAPTAVSILHSGLEIAFLRLFNRFDIGKISRDAIRTFPSFYQLIPFKNPFLNDLNNEKVDLFNDLRWVENDRHAQLLLDGRRFNQELGNQLSVETLCFFGSRKPTTTFGRVRYAAGGRWERIEWDVTESGDGTVPERSAVHPNAQQKLPFEASHGDIYVIPAVLEKLDWEMSRKYRLGVLAEATVGNFHVQFEPEQDAYAPGEEICLWATIHEISPDGGRTPVFGQVIHADLFLAQDLEGTTDPSGEPVAGADLLDSAVEPGRYEGSLFAPETMGYYRLVCTVTLPDRETPLQMEELVLVEGDIEPPTAMEAVEESPFEAFIPKGLDLPGEEAAGGAAIGGGVAFGQVMGDLEGLEEDSGVTRGIPPAGAEPAGPQEEAPSTLGIEPGDQQAGDAQEEDRFLNAVILDHPKERALPADREFTLAISVDLQQAHEVFQTRFSHQAVFSGGERQVNLKVVVTSPDFNVYTEPQNLRVPKKGSSKNKARFDLEPLHSGQGKLMVYLLKENNFVQGLQITLNVGEPANRPAIENIENLGRPVDGAFAVQPRDLSLIIKKETGGFTFTLISATVSEAFLPITPDLLNSIVSDTRRRMLEVVYLWEDAQGKVNLLPPGSQVPPSIRLAYQSSLKISENVAKEGLRRMAEAGHLLFEQIFFSNAAGPDSIAMGEKLRSLLLTGQYKLQIVSQEFMLPWGVLYLSDGDGFDRNAVSSERFVGFRHIVEHIPLQKDSQVTDPLIRSLPALNLSVNFDEGIDVQFSVEAVKDQLEYFRGLAGPRVKVVERKTAQDFLEAWGDRTNQDQILYFYGHAVSKQLAEGGGPGRSSLQLSNKALITLDDLKLRASTRQKLSGAPLIFINACESAELSPLFYDGFMPYFVARGARGMIGTECQVPVRFGDEWARRFFRLFLSGDHTLGEIMLKLRCQFLEENNNLLGLLYALYCDGDTKVVPGI